MAENNGNTNLATPPTKKSDLVSEIGTLTYPRAVERFGKDKAISVLHQVAAIGGHGLFEDSDFLSPMFGGLAMPAPEKVIRPEKSAFAHLPEPEFHFQAALEEYETLKEKAAANRAAINDLYHNLK